jgi:hypothetical protein
MDPLTQYAEQLDAAIAAVRQSLDRDARGKERAEYLKPYGPTGAWRFAPKIEKERAAVRIAAEQDRRAGVALYTLGRLRRDAEPVVAAAVESQKQPPTPEDAWRKRTGQLGVNAEVFFLMAAVDELRQGRLAAELAKAPPSEWLDRYQKALADPLSQEGATVVRVIENAAARAEWSGAPIDVAANPSEGAALQRFRSAVNAARDARVSPETRAAADAIGRARQLEDTLEGASVRPINPALEPQSDESGAA